GAGERLATDLDAAAYEIAHRRRQQHFAVVIGEALGDAAAHRGDERMRRSEIDADRVATRVRLGRSAELGDAALDVGGEALDEHQPADLARRRLRVVALVERGSEPLARQPALAPELALDGVDLVARP